MIECPVCTTNLPSNARFCLHCGAPVEQRHSANTKNNLQVDLLGDIRQQLSDLFLKELLQRVKQVHDPKRYPDYSERLYQSGFRETVARRVEQLAGWIDKNAAVLEVQKVNRRIDRMNADLLDFFIIHYCADLNEVRLSEAILSYQELEWNSIDLFQMTLDYLDFANETETVYTDFVHMPVNKLRNAGQSFLFPQRNEKILLICDQSLLGSCKEGFAFTEKAIYWKAHLQKSAVVAFDELHDIQREKDWITINGQFFNATPSLNIKTLLLLRKIKDLQR